MIRFRVAILVPVYGHLEYALAAARSALEHTPDSGVLILDDGSPRWKPAGFQKLGKKYPERVLLHRFPINGGLTRSWNHGLLWAQSLQCEYAVAGNSDVLYPPGWWPPLEQALALGGQEGGLDLAGPLTNAPGHRRTQDVAAWLANYQKSDQMEYLARVQASLQELYPARIAPGPINGFCLCARVAHWVGAPHRAGKPFDPKHKMIRQEDELCGRFKKRGLSVGCVPASFVFHYRGISRKNATRGTEGRGWFRPTP